MNRLSIYAIIVTYGNREIFLLSSLNALLNQSVKINKILIINNGSKLNYNNNIYQSEFVSVIDLKQNHGSAFAYKEGIKVACNENANLIWLIDDDNVPDEFALEYLLNFDLEKLLDSSIVLSSFRTSRKKYNDLFITYKNPLTINNNNLFFDLKLIKNIKNRQKPLDFIEVDYVTFGGLLFSSKCVNLVGLPDETYFLYMDDRDYTFRIHKFGIKIYVVRSSTIIDLDNSWNGDKYYKLPAYFIPENKRLKTFYSFRNKIRFDLKYTVKNIFIYKNSIKFYILCGCLIAIINGIGFKKIKLRSKLLLSIMTREFQKF